MAKNGKSSCCFAGGSWFQRCGNPQKAKQFDYSWLQGLEACKGKNKTIKNPNLISLEASIEEKTGIKVLIRNKKNNSGQVTFEYKDLDQLNKIIDIIKSNY